MDPGQDKHQQGDHPEVSEDKEEESRWTSPPITVSSTTSSDEDEVGNNSTSSSSTSSSSTSSSSGSGTSSSSTSSSSNSSSGSGTSSSSGSSTSSSSCSCTSCSCTSSSSSSCSGASSSSEDEVGDDCTTSLSQKPQQGISPLTSLESTHGRDKREEPILLPGTSQPYQVGLEKDTGHVTSVTGMNRKRTNGSDAVEEPPTKKTRHSVGEEDPVLSSPHLSPSQYMAHEDPFWLSPVLSPSCIMAHEDLDWSSPVLSPSQDILLEDPFRSSTVLSPSPLDLILEDPILPPSVFSSSPIPFEDYILSFPAISPPQRLGLEEEPGLVTSSTCRKRTKGSDAEEEPPGKKTRHSVAEEDPVLSSPFISPSQYMLREDPFLLPTVSTVLHASPLDPIFEDPILPILCLQSFTYTGI